MFCFLVVQALLITGFECLLISIVLFLQSATLTNNGIEVKEDSDSDSSSDSDAGIISK